MMLGGNPCAATFPSPVQTKTLRRDGGCSCSFRGFISGVFFWKMHTVFPSCRELAAFSSSISSSFSAQPCSSWDAEISFPLADWDLREATVLEVSEIYNRERPPSSQLTIQAGFEDYPIAVALACRRV